MKYIGETARNLKKHLHEHKRDIRLDNSNNILFLHIFKINYNFNFIAATRLTHIHNKRLRQIFEAIAISLVSSVNSRPRFFNLSPFLGKLVVNGYNTHDYTFLSPIY